MEMFAERNIETYIADFGLSCLLVVGNIGNTLVIVLFRRYFRNVSSMYLSGGALFNILYLSFNIPLTIYSYHYTDPSTYSIGFCKFQTYFSLVLGQMARYVIVFACFDRYLATNRQFLAKYPDRMGLAKRFIVLSVLMWCVLDTHHLFLTTIQNGVCGQYGNYYFINRIFLLVSFNTVPPILMIVFGYLAFRQLRRVHSCIEPMTILHSTVLLCRKDRKFLTMIFTEVMMYFLTTSLYLVMSLYLIVKSDVKMNVALPLSSTESLLILCSKCVSYINHVAPFYLYLCLSKEFRQDLIRWLERFTFITAK